MFLAAITLILCLAQWTAGQSCPKEYQRFSPQHTFCIQPNPTCQIKTRGFPNQQSAINDIVSTHNRLRNGVALGQELNAHGLNPASDMLQMTWDPELAAIAQKWAENCKFDHDCNECRAVENFPVGQSIFQSKTNCPGGSCVDQTPDFKQAIEAFYNEVKDFDQRNIDKNGAYPNRGDVGHFTQVIWAKSFRVGCGYVSHLDGSVLKHFLVCNYGPAGNYPKRPIYIAGPTCSNCPINSCCGNTCPGENEFKGLCKLNKNEAPKYAKKPGVLLYCDFSSLDGDCSLTTEGQGAVIKKTLGGNVFSIHLKDGQQSGIRFKTPIRPSSKFCLRITYRKYADKINQADVSTLKVDMQIKDGGTLFLNLGTQNNFTPLGINVQKLTEMTFTLTFSVPAGAEEHILDIKEIEATNGSC